MRPKLDIQAVESDQTQAEYAERELEESQGRASNELEAE
jgi:hypothetical protein